MKQLDKSIKAKEEDADGVQQHREERNGVLCRVRPLGIDKQKRSSWDPLLGIDTHPTERHASLCH